MPESFQERFHRRWRQLNDPHVRAMAWLLDSPDLLNPAALQWRGKIASLATDAASAVQPWLEELDRDPAALHEFLDVQPFSRLGRYAEKLMAFYFLQQQCLLAYGLQVRAEKGETVGEFDFLLRSGDALLHWEFATKFYLLHQGQTAPSTSPASSSHCDADYFVGPNLADTLGAKMAKILDRQLALSAHPAAQVHLPQPVIAAQALVKGWLFYRPGDSLSDVALGVSATHCRGFWCTLGELAALPGAHFAVLPRLRWLAPASMSLAQTIDREGLSDMLKAYFCADSMPMLVAILEERNGKAVEVERGFIVPDDWRQRAQERLVRAVSAQ